MRDIQIGKYLLTKKGFGILIVALFLTGIIIGGVGMSGYLGGNKTSLSILLIFSLVMNWKIFTPQLKKEISIINK